MMRRLILILGFWPLLAWGQNHLAANTAFDLKTRLLNGTSFELKQEKGKVVIVHFWATWCAPCRYEMPLFEQLYQKYKEQGLRIVAISIDEPENDKQVQEVMRAYHYPAALLQDTVLTGYGKIKYVPVTLLLDRQGFIRKDSRQETPPLDGAVLENRIKQLLSEP